MVTNFWVENVLNFLLILINHEKKNVNGSKKHLIFFKQNIVFYFFYLVLKFESGMFLRTLMRFTHAVATKKYC